MSQQPAHDRLSARDQLTPHQRRTQVALLTRAIAIAQRRHGPLSPDVGDLLEIRQQYED
jgi:hypothetical protein